MPLVDVVTESGTTTGLLTYLGQVITAIFGWIPELFDAIVENNLLLLAVGVSICGIVISVAIGIFKRV